MACLRPGEALSKCPPCQNCAPAVLMIWLLGRAIGPSEPIRTPPATPFHAPPLTVAVPRAQSGLPRALRGASGGRGGWCFERAQACSPRRTSTPTPAPVQNGRQPRPSPPRRVCAGVPGTPFSAPPCRSGSRYYFDAVAVPPLLQPSSLLGCSRGRSGGCCRPVFDARLACGPGPLGVKDGARRWPWGRLLSRAGACEHGIALIYP